MLLSSPFFWEDHLHLHIKDSSGFYTKEPRSKYNPVLLQSTCPYTPSSMCLFINPSQPGFLSHILEIANFLIGFHVHGNFLSIILPDSERKADIKNTNHAIKTKEVSRFPKKHVPASTIQPHGEKEATLVPKSVDSGPWNSGWNQVPIQCFFRISETFSLGVLVSPENTYTWFWHCALILSFKQTKL